MAGATLISDVSAGVIAKVQSPSGEAASGPVITGLGFVGEGSGARSAIGLEINNVMRGKINEDTFRQLSIGVDYTGGTDYSGWVLDSDYYYSNVTAIYAGSVSGAGNNIITNSRFDTSTAADLFINIPAGASQLRIIGNHFSCAGLGTSYQGAIQDQGNGVSVIGNSFETCSPAIIIPQGTTGIQ